MSVMIKDSNFSQNYLMNYLNSTTSTPRAGHFYLNFYRTFTISNSTFNPYNSTVRGILETDTGSFPNNQKPRYVP